MKFKYSFKNDYSEGCHINILKRLTETNLQQQTAYGDDEFSEEAKNILKKKIGDKNAGIYFVSGGTQANLTLISAFLRTHESIISAKNGHIFNHEAGAIEATGHKVIAIESEDGKIAPKDIQQVLEEHSNIPHMVKPKLVYISNSTEIGTIYRKKELEYLSSFCRQNKLYLFMDGARIGHALCAQDNDLTFTDIHNHTDAFYIGGTKNGALLGEAIVIKNENLNEDFAFIIKQKGGLLAKGRLLGIQFLELFRDDLYFSLARHANKMAMKISAAIKQKGYTFLTDSTTNQIFPILPNQLIDILSKKYDFYVWKKQNDKESAVRLITSWATSEEIVNEFIEDLKEL